MRTIGVVIMTVLLASSPAAAAWEEYPIPQLGLVVEFPSEPTTSTREYRTALVPSAPVHIYRAEEDESLFLAAVVDLADRGEEGASILGEAEFNLQMLGDVVTISTSRVGGGSRAVIGRFLTIDCRRGRVPDAPGQDDTARAYFRNLAGFECQDGTRLTVNMFFNRGRLYLLQAVTPPNPEEDSFGPSAMRFALSLVFLAP